MLFPRSRVDSAGARDLMDPQSVALAAFWSNAEDRAWDGI
jgi:hypothetical protein